jgi:hypothetical protein
MSKGKSSDSDRRFDNRPSGGRVADKDKGTIYSPKQIDNIKGKSDEKRPEKK